MSSARTRFERRLPLGLRDARRRVRRDRDLTLPVQAIDRCRSRSFVERHEVAQLDQLAGAAGTADASIDSGVRRNESCAFSTTSY